MSLLFPLYLLGAAAITLPILLHRRRQRPNERTHFSSLMFLEPTPPRVKTRTRLENLLLLALRCLAFLLLVLCFARPFLPSKDNLAGAGQGERVLLLVDVSASMRREGLQEKLRQQMADRLAQLGERDRLAVLAFDHQVRPLLGFAETDGLEKEKRGALVMERLAGAPPGWGGTRLAQAFVAATEWIAEDEARAGASAAQGGRILLFGDMQEGAGLDALGTFEWPRNVQIDLEPVEVSGTSNAGLLLAASGEGTLDTGKEHTRVRIWNAEDSDVEKFRLHWAGSEAAAAETYVPAGKSRVVRAPERPAPGASTLVLSGDQQDFDNHLHIAPELPRQLSIVYLGERSESGPKGSLFYLERAFQSTRHLAPRLTSLKALPASAEFRPQDVHLVVAESPITQGNIESLKHYLDGGRTLLHILNDEADLGALQQLCGTDAQPAPAPPASAPDPSEYHLVQQLDTRHPVLAPFAEPRFRDFTKVHFWQHRRWTEGRFAGESVLARFDNGAPALVELPVGQGSVLVLTSSWRPQDSQLAVSTKFVPLLFSILERSAGALSRTSRFTTGQSVPLPQVPRPLAVVRPDGRRLEIKPGQETFTDTGRPGLYRLETSEAELTFAVNLPAQESQTTPMDPDRLAQFGVQFYESTAGTTHPDAKKSQKPFAEIENRQKIWKWLLAAACVFFILETWLAGRLTRPVAAQGS